MGVTPTLVVSYVLLEWISNGASGVVVTDLAKGRTASLYNGLRHIPTDGVSVLGALLDLSCPSSLSYIPLVTPYCVARTIHNEDKGSTKGSRMWKIRIGVYMNRLLPEVLTASTLHIVMYRLIKVHILSAKNCIFLR